MDTPPCQFPLYFRFPYVSLFCCVFTRYPDLALSPLLPNLHKLNLLLHPQTNPLYPPQSRQILPHPLQHALLVAAQPVVGRRLAVYQRVAAAHVVANRRAVEEIRIVRAFVHPVTSRSRVGRRGGGRGQRGIVVDALGDAHADAVRRLRGQAPQPRDVLAGHRRRDVAGGVAQTDGEDLGAGRCGEQAWREG